MIRKIVFTAFSTVVLIGLLFLSYRWYRGSSNSNDYIRRWLRNPSQSENLHSPALQRCGDAPFVLPSEGFIGLLWRDTAAPYNALNRHTGIDIFGRGQKGTVPVYAVYDGLLTRLDTWRSSIIIQHTDPLQSDRKIWTYYTHMASTGGDSFIDEAFPAGTYAMPVEQGTLIGFQGAYNPAFPIATHVHLSIVTSDLDGSFLNEAILGNTLDPSPYFGMDLNADTQLLRPVNCNSD